MRTLIKDYAANYDTIDDTQAKSHIARALKFEEDSLDLALELSS
jgi:hypothetical protein